jgi:hypothetical protein
VAVAEEQTMDVTPAYLRYASQLRGSTKTGVIANALTAAAERIESLTAEHAGIIEFLGKHSTDQAAEIEQLKETIRAFGRGDIVPITDKDDEIERLRAALEEVLKMSADVPSEDGGELLEALCKRALGNEQKADGQ